MFKIVFPVVAMLCAAPVLAAPAVAFNGPFIGVQGGWQQDNLDLVTSAAGTSSGVLVKKPSFTYGGQIGYDHLLAPRLVVGAEGSVTGVTGSHVFGDAAGNAYSLAVGRTLTASARAGFLVLPQGLAYVRVGYTNARFNLSDPVGQNSKDRSGVLFGVGYEHAIAGPVSARVEYDYSHFGSGSLPGTATNIGADAASGDYDRHAITLGVNYRF